MPFTFVDGSRLTDRIVGIFSSKFKKMFDESDARGMLLFGNVGVVTEEKRAYKPWLTYSCSESLLVLFPGNNYLANAFYK